MKQHVSAYSEVIIMFTNVSCRRLIIMRVADVEISSSCLTNYIREQLRVGGCWSVVTGVASGDKAVNVCVCVCGWLVCSILGGGRRPWALLACDDSRLGYYTPTNHTHAHSPPYLLRPSSHHTSAPSYTQLFSYIICKAWWWDLNIRHSHYY